MSLLSGTLRHKRGMTYAEVSQVDEEAVNKGRCVTLPFKSLNSETLYFLLFRVLDY